MLAIRLSRHIDMDSPVLVTLLESAANTENYVRSTGIGFTLCSLIYLSVLTNTWHILGVRYTFEEQNRRNGERMRKYISNLKCIV